MAVVYSGTNDEVFLYCLSHIAQLILDDPTLVVLAVSAGSPTVPKMKILVLPFSVAVCSH